MKRTRLAALLLAITVAAIMPPRAQAETAACTVIDNTASVAYKVSTISQTAVPGSVSFKVGNKINLSVVATSATYKSIIPGATDQIIEFTVNNLGNATQDYSLSLAHIADPFGGTDNFNAGSILGESLTIYVDNPVAGGASIVGTFDATDTLDYVDELAPLGSRKVFVVYTPVDLARVDADISAIDLIAVAAAGGTATTEGAAETAGAANACGGTAPTVFADDDHGTSDALKDGKSSDDGAYKVVTAKLTVEKTTNVYYDPINCSSLNPLTCTGTPKLIPGAYFTYRILVTNNGSVAASDVTITDSLAAEIADGSLAFQTRYDADATVGYTCATGPDEGLYVDGVCKTNAADVETPAAEFIGNIVTVSGLTIASGGGTADIKFQVSIP